MSPSNYCYDEEGDILSKTEYNLTFEAALGEPIDTITCSYSDGLWRNGITSYDGEIIYYDIYGNPTSYRGYTMEWVKGRQLSVVYDDELRMQFKYNQSGIRTSKTVNGVKTEYTYVGDLLVSQKTGGEVINFAYTAGGAPLGFTYNGTPYFYLLSLQGDVIAVYDSTGELVIEYTYDSWGKLISSEGSLAGTIGIKNPIRYRGYYYDVETGLYYLQSRYYDPETGRFINPDAYLIAGDDVLQGTNMYAYCYNNPVMYVDPTGFVTTEEAIYLSVGIVAGLMFLSENMPLLDIDIFVRTLGENTAALSGVEIADIILSLCLLVSEGALEGVNRGDYFAMASEHHKKGTTNPSNLNKHQKGQTRKKKDAGGEKGDERRTNYRKNKDKVKKFDIGAVGSAISTVGAVVGLAYVVVNNVTGAGVSDDFLIPVFVRALV